MRSGCQQSAKAPKIHNEADLSGTGPLQPAVKRANPLAVGDGTMQRASKWALGLGKTGNVKSEKELPTRPSFVIGGSQVMEVQAESQKLQKALIA